MITVEGSLYFGIATKERMHGRMSCTNMTNVRKVYGEADRKD